MAGIRRTTDLRGLRAVTRILSLATLVCASGLTQGRLTLEQAGSRTGPDLVPAYEGKEIAVRGQVSSRPVLTATGDQNTYYLPIQDETAHGILLQGDAAKFNGVQPGDWIDVTGTLERRAGMPVLLAREISVNGHAAPPFPKEVRLETLNSFRYLGVLVTSESRISVTAEDTGGDVVTLADRGNRIRVFLAQARRSAKSGLEGYRTGDLVRATGIATQNCTLPPYDRSYQILLVNSGSLVLVEKAWLFPPSMVLSAVAVILLLLVLFSLRERTIARLRRTLRGLNAAGEEMIGAASPTEIVRKLMAVLPKLLRISGAGIFIANRQAQTLESFYGEGSASEYADIQPPAAPILEAASAAFRNRTLLSVPDSRRSPFFTAGKTRPPRSALFVPMFAQSELVGILEIERSDRVHHFGEEEQTAMQHLANQVAAALKLQEQQAIREQMFRTEKLASAAQLMSGIANELRSPLESIVNCLDLLRSREGGGEPLISTIALGAHRAREIVQRLLAFSRADHVEAEPVDLNEMVLEVADLHGGTVRSRNIAIRRRLSTQTLIALGSREQLAQVVLNLLIYAEQSLAETRAAEIRITSALLARRALIEVSWPARGADVDPDRGAADLIEKTGLSLEVCHGIIQSHGGELRVSHSGSDVRFELDLPVIETRQHADSSDQLEADARRQLTVLVVEPEAGSQRHVVNTFSGMGHRVVPVASAEEGADLAERMRFDIAVCALRLPGLSWAGFLERVRGQVGGVILLTDAYDPKLMRTFQSSDVFVVNKPADPAEIKHVCEVVAESATLLTGPRT